jgi:hypothetical protein
MAEFTNVLSGQVSAPQNLTGSEKFFRGLERFGSSGLGTESIFDRQNRELSVQRKQALLADAFTIQQDLTNNNLEGARGTLIARLDAIRQVGGDDSDTRGLLDKIDSGDFAGAMNDVSTVVNFGAAQGLIELPGSNVTEAAGTREFKALTAGLSDNQKQEAKLIKLGLSPRAVGSAIQTIAEKDLAELVGNASATIKQREKFGEATGASRAKTIDKGFQRITQIDAGIRNIERAVALLDKGAGVGSIESLLPSFKAASVALDNIQGLMALDVVGATTFGALSKGELDLAKEIALPTGLDTDQLIEHLRDKKTAQTKLRDYFSEQIQFLDQGGTVAGFLRQKEREQGDQQPVAAQPQATSGQGQQGLSGLSIEELIQMRQQAQ